MSQPLNPTDPDRPALCTCPQNGVTELHMLDDLIAYGFGQHQASHMLWDWPRDVVSRRLQENVSP